MQSTIAQQGKWLLPGPESLIGLLQTLIALLVFPFKEGSCAATGKRGLSSVFAQFGPVGLH